MEVEEIHGIVEEGAPNVRGITVLKDGKTVFEEAWGGFNPGDPVNVMSVTKSVMALLMGIAIDRGALKGVDVRVLDFFLDYPVKRGEKTIQEVTVRHLLTMTAPFKYKSEPWKRVCTSADWTRTILDFLGGRKGLTGEFTYATLGLQILGGLLTRATGENVLDFANRRLFKPLGIAPRQPHGDSSKEDQLDFLLNRNPRRREWYVDPTGCPTSGWGLALSATDMVRIGELCRRGGTFDGKRIVSESWIRSMTTPYRDLDDRFGNLAYGYLWWIVHKHPRVYAAIGDGGNVIYVNSKKRVSVGVASLFKPRVFDRIDFIERRLLPDLGI